MNTRVWHKVGLELVEIDIKRTIKAQARGDGADDLGDQAIKVLVVGTGNIQAASADIVHGLVIDEEGAVGVLDRAMGRQDGVVGLHHGGRDARSRVNGEFELALLAVVGGKALEEERTEARTSTTTERVENEETLERRAVVCRCQ